MSAELARAGLSRGNSVAHLSGVERGTGRASPELIRALDELLGAKRRLLALLRDAKVPEPDVDATQPITLTAHIFFPALVGGSSLPLPKTTAPVRLGYISDVVKHPCKDGHDLYFFPFGVVVAHEQYQLTLGSLTEVSTWRHDQLGRVTDCLHTHLVNEFNFEGEVVDEHPYGLSCFNLHQGPWQDPSAIDRAVRVLSNPSLLHDEALESPSDAIRTETRLLSGEQELEDLSSFGHTTKLIGWASWAGVAISESERAQPISTLLIEFELQLQALWCYASNVERLGSLPSAAHDVRFLKDALRSLRLPRPTEHTPIRRMREALVNSSRIAETVSGAIDSLSP